MLAPALPIRPLLVVTPEFYVRWATAMRMKEMKPLQLQGELRVPLPLLPDEPIMIQGQPLDPDLPLEPIELVKPLDQSMKLAVMLLFQLLDQQRELAQVQLALEPKRMQRAQSTAYPMGGENDSLASASGGIGFLLNQRNLCLVLQLSKPNHLLSETDSAAHNPTKPDSAGLYTPFPRLRYCWWWRSFCCF